MFNPSGVVGVLSDSQGYKYSTPNRVAGCAKLAVIISVPGKGCVVLFPLGNIVVKRRSRPSGNICNPTLPYVSPIP